MHYNAIYIEVVVDIYNKSFPDGLGQVKQTTGQVVFEIFLGGNVYLSQDLHVF